MISISRLTESLDGDWVVFDENGATLTQAVPPGIGPAALIVSSVTDALKSVVDGSVQSLDRDEMWAVEAIVLGREVLAEIEDVEMTVEGLLARVAELGYSWQVSPISSP